MSVKYRKLKAYKYQILEEFSIMLSLYPEQDIATEFFTFKASGELTAVPGYSWDGATCFPDYPWIMLPSLVHDIMCQMVKEELIPESFKADADVLLRNMCRERIIKINKDANERHYPEIMADIVYAGVTKFGRFFMHKGEPQDVIYSVA